MIRCRSTGWQRVKVGATILALLCTTQACGGPLRDAIKNARSGGERDMQRSTEEEMNEDGGSAAIVLPPGARVLRDIAYGADAQQRIDVYLPKPSAEAAPIIFMVHGGAWMVGDKGAGGVVSNKLAHWLPKGYILVSANYRLMPAADPLEQAHDVARALALAQTKAHEWNGDATRLLLMGHSAGAHLVSLLASAPAIATAENVRPWLGTVALDSAAYDVVQIMQNQHRRFYDKAFGRDPAYWRRASPVHQLNAAPRPVLAVCATSREDGCQQTQHFADRIKALGGQATVLPVALSHKEINHELGLPGAYTDAVDAFIRSLGLP